MLLRSVLVIAACIAISVGGCLLVGLHSAGAHAPRLAELERFRSMNRELEREIRDLRDRVAAMRDDDRALARVARDEMNMIRDGEMVFDFSEPAKTPGTTTEMDLSSASK